MKTDSETERDVSESSDNDSSEESELEDTEQCDTNPTAHRPLLSERVMGTRTKNMSLEDLIKMRDRVGTKQFNEQVLKNGKGFTKNSKPKLLKRENKNRPQELSSKARVPKFREIIQTPKDQRTIRDPRFDNLCGSEYDEELFDNRYNFLQQIREREMKSLKKQLVKRKAKGSDKQTLKYLLTRMEQQDSAKKDRIAKREKLREWKKEEKEKVAQGIKKPFFLKKSDKKKMFNEMKLSQRKEQGTLAKVEARKEKKRKSKESRVMPYQRRTTSVK